MKPIYPKEFEPSKYSSSGKKRKIKNVGVDILDCFYESNRPLSVQFPKMKAPFGVTNKKESQKYPTSDDKYIVDYQLDTNEPDIAEVKKMLEKIDQMNIQFIADNSEALLGKKQDYERVAEYHYRSMIIKGKDSYPDRFSFKLSYRDDKATGKRCANFGVLRQSDDDEKKFLQVVTANKSEPDMSWSFKGMQNVPIGTFEGMWFVNSKFHPKWKIEIVKVYSNKSNTITANSFRNEDGDEDTVVQASKEDLKNMAAANADLVEEDDDDNDEEIEIEEEDEDE